MQVVQQQQQQQQQWRQPPRARSGGNDGPRLRLASGAAQIMHLSVSRISHMSHE